MLPFDKSSMMAVPEVRLHLSNPVEASLLAEILEQDGIPYTIHSNQDTAYGGLWQFQQGWGFVETPARFASGVQVLLRVIRRSGEDGAASLEEEEGTEEE
jgi:hypothetical protein